MMSIDRRLSVVLSLAAVSWLAIPSFARAQGCYGSPPRRRNAASSALDAKAPSKGGRQPEDRTLSLRIGGMTCDACAQKVRKALERVEGVSRAEVDFKSGLASVRCKPDVRSASLAGAVVGAGFRAKPVAPSRVKSRRMLFLRVDGMTCGGRAAGLAAHVSAVRATPRRRPTYRPRRASPVPHVLLQGSRRKPGARETHKREV